MEASNNLIDKLKEFEGWHMQAYKCPAGKWTIGAGHTQGVRPGMKITETRALEFLKADLATAEKYVNGLKLKLTQGQFDALVDFCFNLGVGSLSKSTLLKYVRHGATDLMIVREFMKWVRSGGVVLDGLVKRRKWEAETFTGKEVYRDERLHWLIRKSGL